MRIADAQVGRCRGVDRRGGDRRAVLTKLPPRRDATCARHLGPRLRLPGRGHRCAWGDDGILLVYKHQQFLELFKRLIG
jgi:hypothetical protein